MANVTENVIIVKQNVVCKNFFLILREVQIFWEGHNSLTQLPPFICQIKGGSWAKNNIWH